MPDFHPLDYSTPSAPPTLQPRPSGWTAPLALLAGVLGLPLVLLVTASIAGGLHLTADSVFVLLFWAAAVITCLVAPCRRLVVSRRGASRR